MSVLHDRKKSGCWTIWICRKSHVTISASFSLWVFYFKASTMALTPPISPIEYYLVLSKSTSTDIFTDSYAAMIAVYDLDLVKPTANITSDPPNNSFYTMSHHGGPTLSLFLRPTPVDSDEYKPGPVSLVHHVSPLRPFSGTHLLPGISSDSISRVKSWADRYPS